MLLQRIKSWVISSLLSEEDNTPPAATPPQPAPEIPHAATATFALETSSILLQQLQSTEAELKKTKNQLRSMELRAKGYNLSPDLSQGVFVVSDDGLETLAGGEQELADRILDPERTYTLMDITESLITFMADMKQSGKAPAAWSEDTVLGRLTLSSNFVKDSLGKTIRPTAEEKVFLKIGPRQFLFDRTSPDFRKALTSPEAREDRDYLEKRILRNSGVDYATINKIFLERKVIGDITPLVDITGETLGDDAKEREIVLPDSERLKHLATGATGFTSLDARTRFQKEFEDLQKENLSDMGVQWIEIPQEIGSTNPPRSLVETPKDEDSEK